MRAITLLVLWTSIASAVAVARRAPEADAHNVDHWSSGYEDQVMIHGPEAKVGDYDVHDYIFEDDSDLSSSDDDDYLVEE